MILIDDEWLSLEYLERSLLKIGDIYIAGKFTNPFQAKEAVCDTDVDLVFLDIQLPGINGLRLAEQLVAVKPQLKIVFITAYTHYAVKAFELNAMDYLVKPVTAERLTKPLHKFREMSSIQ
ncbi:Transcriptional regulatory protein YehT [compost metagenome]